MKIQAARLERLPDVSGKVGFGAGRSYAGCNELPGSYFEVGYQTLGAMPLVFEFLALDMTGLDGQGGVQTFQGLDASHFIGTYHVCPPQQASVWPRRPRRLYRSAQPVQWGRRVVA